MELQSLAQSVIAMIVITAPPDPVKILFFNAVVERDGLSHTSAAFRVAFAVLVILGGSALVGAEALNLLGIDLNAFGVVGGLVVAAMGFEMLYGGATSRTQGKRTGDDGPKEDTGLLIPLAMPLIAGPGAIVTTITISSADARTGWVEALAGAVVVALLAFLSLRYLGAGLGRMPDRSRRLLLRFGGLILATIGTQMLLSGLKAFFTA